MHHQNREAAGIIDTQGTHSNTTVLARPSSFCPAVQLQLQSCDPNQCNAAPSVTESSITSVGAHLRPKVSFEGRAPVGVDPEVTSVTVKTSCPRQNGPDLMLKT